MGSGLRGEGSGSDGRIKKDLVQRSGSSRGVVTINGYIISKKTISPIAFFNRQVPQRFES